MKRSGQETIRDLAHGFVEEVDRGRFDGFAHKIQCYRCDCSFDEGDSVYGGVGLVCNTGVEGRPVVGFRGEILCASCGVESSGDTNIPFQYGEM